MPSPYRPEQLQETIFSETMNGYISKCKICVDEIPIEEAKSAAEEVILTLETICVRALAIFSH